MALVELSVVEQRYRAVLEAAAGVPVTEVAARYEVSRKACTPGWSAIARAGWALWRTGRNARYLPAPGQRGDRGGGVRDAP